MFHSLLIISPSLPVTC